MSIHLPRLSNHHTVSNFNTQGAQKKRPYKRWLAISVLIPLKICFHHRRAL